MAANTNASSSIVNNNSSNSNIGKLEKNTERDNKLSSALGFPSNNSSSNLNNNNNSNLNSNSSSNVNNNNNNNSNPNSNRSSNINARGQRLNTSRKNVRPASSNSVSPASSNSVSASSNLGAPVSSNLGSVRSKISRLPQDSPELSPYSINQQINNSTNQSRFSNNNNNNSSSLSSSSSSSLSPSSSSRFGRSSRIAPSPSTSGSTFSSILPTNSSSPPNLSTSRFTTTSPSSSSSNVTQRNLPKKPEGYVEKNITNPGELATLKPQQKVTVKSTTDNSFKEVTIIEGSFGDKVYKDPNNNNKYLKFLTFDPATTILVKSQRGGKGKITRNKRKKNIKKTKSKHI